MRQISIPYPAISRRNKQCCQQVCYQLKKIFLPAVLKRENTGLGDEVVRALAFRQCGPTLNSNLDAICRLSLLVL